MDQALIGLAGIVVGALLGGTGKYFTQRRDAWARARTSGLLLLADVRALRGFRAPEWLALADCFSHLQKLSTAQGGDRGAEWWKEVGAQLQEAEKLLDRFADDPPVFPYVLRRSLGRSG